MERFCMGFYEINSNEKTVMYCTIQIELNNLKRSTDYIDVTNAQNN